MSTAEDPAEAGVAIEVPAQLWTHAAQFLVELVTCSPVAIRSGLIRPSSVGPRLLKPAMPRELADAAPIVMMFFAVAGGPMVSPPGPDLPAAKSTRSS